MKEIKGICSGCGLCAAVCPAGAIYCEEKERGAIYYHIGDGCIDCGKCERMCPNGVNLFHNKQTTFYVAISKDKEVLDKSSSGGIAYELGVEIIHGGGVVYGAGWNASRQLVQHMRIDNVEDLRIIQGSKYVQSSIDKKVYQSINKDVQEREVLVVGTPCQVAAIRQYVKDSPNLYSIDLICHGVPSAQLLTEQLNLITLDPIENISFRKGLEFRLDVHCKDKEYSFEGIDNPYYALFLSFTSLRDSCYECQYACSTRVGEITLGDYVEDNKGYSCVIINTEKGRFLLNRIAEKVNFKECDSNLLQDNHAYNRPTAKNSKTEKFTSLYHKYGLVNAYYRCFPVLIIKRKLRGILGEGVYVRIKKMLNR